MPSSNTASLDAAVVAENGGSVMAPTLQPSMDRVTAQVTVGGVTSVTFIDCALVAVSPQALASVHVRKMTSGNVLTITSI